MILLVHYNCVHYLNDVCYDCIQRRLVTAFELTSGATFTSRIPNVVRTTIWNFATVLGDFRRYWAATAVGSTLQLYFQPAAGCG